jgi:hypothetical protein
VAAYGRACSSSCYLLSWIGYGSFPSAYVIPKTGISGGTEFIV